jgi:hypothetical protein
MHDELRLQLRGRDLVSASIVAAVDTSSPR